MRIYLLFQCRFWYVLSVWGQDFFLYVHFLFCNWCVIERYGREIPTVRRLLKMAKNDTSLPDSVDALPLSHHDRDGLAAKTSDKSTVYRPRAFVPTRGVLPIST